MFRSFSSQSSFFGVLELFVAAYQAAGLFLRRSLWSRSLVGLVAAPHQKSYVAEEEYALSVSWLAPDNALPAYPSDFAFTAACLRVSSVRS